MKMSVKAQVILEEVRQRLLSGDVGPLVDFAKLQVKGYDKPMSKWSTLNQLLAYLTTGSIDCRGINQWREIGRWIKPSEEGGRATYIRVRCIEKYNKNEPETPENIASVYYKWVPVFPDTATVGQPLPEPEPIIVDQLPDLYEVCKKVGIKVEYADLPGAWGCVDQGATLIQLKTKHPKVFYHELAHAIRLKNGWYNLKDYDGEEVIADTVGCVFSQLFDGEDTTHDTLSYLTHYLGSIDKMVDFLGDINKTMLTLLDVSDMTYKEA